jgi:trimeric autotransporter adhesin
MSTKTTFKRIALVAVAALGLGVISVVPSQAAVSSYALSVDANDAISTGETATAVLTQSFFASAAADSAVVTAIIRSGSTAVGRLALAVTDSATSASTVAGAAPTRFTDSGANPLTGIVLANATATKVNASAATQGVVVTNKYAVILYNVAVAGTYNVDFYSTDGAGAATNAASLVTWTVTVKAAAGPDATSTSYIHAGSSPAVAADSATITAVRTAGTVAANIKTTQLTAGAATAAPESITATITGSGTLGVHASAPASATSLGRALTVRHDNFITVFADGSSGVGTITLTGSTSGIIYKTATVTFYNSTPASATVTVKKAYPAAGRTTTAAVYVVVKDASGNLVQNATVDIEPTTTGTGETTTACAFSATLAANVCSVTGTSTAKFGKVTYKSHVTGADAALTELYSAPFDLTFSDIVATKVALSAPATGAVGDKVTVTLTATEKNGFPVADSTYEGGSANGSVGGIFWNTTTVPVYSSANFKPFNAGETITTTSGVATVDLYLPAVSGTITAEWKLAGSSTTAAGAIDKTIGGTTATVSIAVANPGVDAATDAANEATDAANAATDAALAAADAADAATAAAQDASDAVAALSASVSKLISSLRAQITSLTNLVIKIQKKVRA